MSAPERPIRLEPIGRVTVARPVKVNAIRLHKVINMTETQPNRFRYSVGCLLLAVILVSGGVASCVWFVKWAEGEFEIATIDCGNNREIVITAARSWEHLQPIYYLVRVDGVVVVPTTYIDNNDPGNDPSEIRFAKFTTADGNLVGITYADNPSEYLIVHNFVDNASFPRGDRINWDQSLDVDESCDQYDRAQAALENVLNESRKQQADDNPMKPSGGLGGS